MSNFPLLSSLLWPLLVLSCLAFILAGLRTVLKKTGWDQRRQQNIFYGATAVIAGWVLLVTVLSVNHFFSNVRQLPPRPVVAMLLPLPVALLIAYSKKGSRLIQSVPPQWLVFIQSFRIAVELLLWLAFLAGRLPVQMNFEGRNFDVLTGLAALPAGYWLLKRKTGSRKIIIVFNVMGILLLLNVLIIAALSMPTPFRYFMNEPSTALLGLFPFILLPAVLVPMAYTMHIFSLRQLSK